jgi:glycosyltransferase involved in cell wall biosynthesis
MIVTLISAEFPPRPGGVGDYTWQLGHALTLRGHSVFVLTIYDLRFTIYDLNRQQNNRKSTIVNRKSLWGWRSWREIISALDQLRPDVLHIQYQTGAYGMHPAINLLPWRLGRRSWRPAVVVTAHDLLLPYLFPKAGPLRRWVTRRLMRDADAIGVTNQADFVTVRDWRLEIGDYGRISKLQSPSSKLQPPALIPIGSNIPVAPPEGYARDAWRLRLQVTPDQTLVAYFGLISHSKGLDTLLGALAQLPPHFRVLIIGGAATAPEDRAYAEHIRRAIDDQGLEPRVITTGHCEPSDVSAHLLAADLAALPFADGASFRRGSLLAALAHGVPTVTTYPPGDERPTTNDERLADQLTDVDRWSLVVGRLVDGEHALLVRPGDAAALTAAIVRLADDPALRQRLSAGARSLAARFMWPEIAAQHEALYDGLIARG